MEKLRQMLEMSGGTGVGEEGAAAGGGVATREMNDLKEKLRISESLMQEMTMTWEQKVKATEKIHQVRTYIYNTYARCSTVLQKKVKKLVLYWLGCQCI